LDGTRIKQVFNIINGKQELMNRHSGHVAKNPLLASQEDLMPGALLTKEEGNGRIVKLSYFALS
jgi:hypothetical protein